MCEEFACVTCSVSLLILFVGLFLPAVVRPILHSLEASKQVKAPPSYILCVCKFSSFVFMFPSSVFLLLCVVHNTYLNAFDFPRFASYSCDFTCSFMCLCKFICFPSCTITFYCFQNQGLGIKLTC